MLGIVGLLVKNWKLIGVLLLFAGTFYAGYHVKGKFDAADQAVAVQKAIKAQAALDKKEIPVLTKNATDKAANVQRFKQSTTSISRLHGPFLDQGVPEVFSGQWNKDAK